MEVFGPRSARISSPPVLEEIKARYAAVPGDLILLLADSWEVTCKGLNALRRRLAAELKLYEPGPNAFLSWVVEFPMFDWDAEEGRWVAMHHPFTAARSSFRTWNFWTRPQSRSSSSL